MTDNPPVLSYPVLNQLMAVIADRLKAVEQRLSAVEKRLSKLGSGPHTLVASDGSMAFCGGPGHCQACDWPTKIWYGSTYRDLKGRVTHNTALVTQQRRHFIPDYGSEGEY